MAPAIGSKNNRKLAKRLFDLSAKDYKALLQANPSDIYRVIWYYLALERAGANAMVELVNYTDKIDANRWPGPVVKLFLGQVGPRDVMASLEGLSGDKLREQQCEALFYLGQYFIIEGDPETATTLFRQSLDTGITNFIEYTGAKAELERLGLL